MSADALTPSAQSTSGFESDHNFSFSMGAVDIVSTFTLVFQLGYILSTADPWEKARIRLFLVVDVRADVDSELKKVKQVLVTLRMESLIDIHIVCIEEEQHLVNRALERWKQYKINGKRSVRRMKRGLRKGLRIPKMKPAKGSRESSFSTLMGDYNDSDVPSSGIEGEEEEVANERDLFPTPKTLFQGNPENPDQSLPFRLLPRWKLICQCMVLNQFMRWYSSHNEIVREHRVSDGVILTALPPFPRGISHNKTLATDYVYAIQELTKDLGPMVMMQTNQLTVTTQI
jgi:hypothetical protein